MKDYTVKTVFVGMDVHKNTYSVTAICDKVIIKRDTLKAHPDALITYLKKRYAQEKSKRLMKPDFVVFTYIEL